MYASVGAFCSPYVYDGAFCSPYPYTGAFCSIFASLGAPIFLCVLLFRGVMSFDLIGLPRFMYILDSFANYHSTLISVGAFVVGICDFVIFFVLINSSSN